MLTKKIIKQTTSSTKSKATHAQSQKINKDCLL